jgi:hypothetical protein
MTHWRTQFSYEGDLKAMSSIRAFWKWLLENLLGFALAGCVVFLALPHLLFGFPFRSLMGLFLDENLVFVAASPMLYFSMRRARVTQDSKALALSAAVALEGICLVIWYWAAKLQIVSPERAWSLGIANLVALPLMIAGGYFLGPKMAVLPAHLRSSKDRKSGER